MISVVVLARLLTPTDFGLVAMVASVASVLNILRDLGLSDATIQAPHITHKQVSALFWVNSLFGTGTTLLLMICSPLIALLFKEPRLTKIAFFYSLSFIFIGFSTQHVAILKRKMEFLKISAFSISSSVISILVAILLAANGFGYWAIIAKQAAMSACLVIGAWIFCRWRPGRPSLHSGARPMIRFGRNIVGNYVMNYFAGNVDKALIGWRSGATSLGFYDRAYQISSMPFDLLILPVQSVAVTTLSKLITEPEEFKRFFLNSMSILAFIGMPLSGVLALASKDLVLLLLGPQWAIDVAYLFNIKSRYRSNDSILYPSVAIYLIR